MNTPTAIATAENPWPVLLARYGLEFVIELAAILAQRTDPTADDFRALKAKYATKTAAEILAEAEARAGTGGTKTP